ncbi:MAG: polymorphic toxin type 44 domain-containing protein [Aquimonas sp.]|nr:polymorphic toxin type 44 domain-containing protein [Aquimonas sp.]
MSRYPGPTGLHFPAQIDSGTLGLFLSQAPQPAGLQRARAVDELTPIARWMAREMLTNASSEEAQRIQRLNSYSFETCVADTRDWPWWQQMLAGSQWQEACLNQAISSKAAAHTAWGLLVRQDGRWDHKPIIARRFRPAVDSGEQHFHRYHGHVYFYDVWSNIHYGYVGRACGFSEAELLDGAGLEQIASDLMRGRRPNASQGVQGLRRFDHPEDRVSVEIGLQLWRQPPGALDASALVSRIVARRAALGARPYP